MPHLPALTDLSCRVSNVKRDGSLVVGRTVLVVPVPATAAIGALPRFSDLLGQIIAEH
ncbi:hypothetical protein MP11Mi_06030 [Gordonia sp. MP11Mi]|uniref:Uncharacterized protein n=1 Tax=Gordonia sp. MP11Mi TaxID=3022769 RepID=A0AA97GUD5_9ACTN